MYFLKCVISNWTNGKPVYLNFEAFISSPKSGSILARGQNTHNKSLDLEMMTTHFKIFHKHFKRNMLFHYCFANAFFLKLTDELRIFCNASSTFSILSMSTVWTNGSPTNTSA